MGKALDHCSYDIGPSMVERGLTTRSVRIEQSSKNYSLEENKNNPYFVAYPVFLTLWTRVEICQVHSEYRTAANSIANIATRVRVLSDHSGQTFISQHFLCWGKEADKRCLYDDTRTEISDNIGLGGRRV